MNVVLYTPNFEYSTFLVTKCTSHVSEKLSAKRFKQSRLPVFGSKNNLVSSLNIRLCHKRIVFSEHNSQDSPNTYQTLNEYLRINTYKNVYAKERQSTAVAVE